MLLRAVFLLITLTWGTSSPLTYSSPLELSSKGAIPLYPDIQWYVDKDRQLDLEDIIERKHHNLFSINSEQNVPNFGFTQAAIWFHISLVNTTQAQHWVLDIGTSKLNSVEAHIIQGSHQRHLHAGEAVPFNQRSISHPNINFALHIPSGQVTEIFLRVTTDAAIDMPLLLWEREAFFKGTQTTKILYSLYYGALLAMLLYNLLLAITLEDSGYTWYVAYIASFGLAQLTLNGLAYEYLWPDSPWWNTRAFHF